MARQGALRGLDAVGSRAPVGWPGAHLDLAHTEVERERTRQVARIGNNLNQIARWASWCSMKSGRKPSTSSRMVRAIARKPCGVIRSGGMSKARNVLSSQTCRLIIGDSGERVSMGQASGLPAGSLDRARTPLTSTPITCPSGGPLAPSSIDLNHPRTINSLASHLNGEHFVAWHPFGRGSRHSSEAAGL